MKPYSLSSQFQGAFLGIVLGYQLGQLKPRPETRSSDSSLNCLELIPGLAQSLIQHQGFHALDYWALVANHREKSQKWEIPQKPASPYPQALNSGSEVAIAGFPLALFFHDNLSSLQKLRLNSPEHLASVWDGVLVMAVAIAQILTQSPELHQLIPNLLKLLPTESALTAKLQQAQTLLQQKATLETAVRQLTQTPKLSRSPQPTVPNHFEPENWTALALGFYCFLSTPEDYSLTVWRCRQTGYQPEITAAIGGALSGAYQGLIAIPVKWRLEFQDPSIWSLTHPEIENNPVKLDPTQEELLHLAQGLFALWSGVYRPLKPMVIGFP
ncbi:MAG: ADP-ribosylglycohydrolase family protein [Planktothrix sp. GU0601_MAG3]|nr:MAG: ADP-ribosylglycohydrolase family protein [Planktothrix sp. GU0601_MAG3]